MASASSRSAPIGLSGASGHGYCSGLLANITLFGAIWSIGLAAFFLFQERQRWRSMLSGVAIFGSALALSIATMVPPADYALLPSEPRLDFNQFPTPLRYVVSACSSNSPRQS